MRLVAGSDFDHWVFVDYNGNLGEFVWDEMQNACVPHARGVGWDAADASGSGTALEPHGADRHRLRHALPDPEVVAGGVDEYTVEVEDRGGVDVECR